MARLSEDMRARFREQMQELKALSSQEKRALLQGIGLLSADGRLTDRFGGDAPLDRDAMTKHASELAADKHDQHFVSFEASMNEFARLSNEEKMRRLRGIGLYGADGELTTRFGGESPLDTEAMAARQWELSYQRRTRELTLLKIEST